MPTATLRKCRTSLPSIVGTLYGDPDELLKHARVVSEDELQENDFNLNIPRYVDTFDPEPLLKVHDALKSLGQAKSSFSQAEKELHSLLSKAGYGSVREC